jgi:hypothetical protein
VQGVQHYSKNPTKDLPPARVFMIKTKLGITDKPKIIITAKAEVEKA